VRAEGGEMRTGGSFRAAAVSPACILLQSSGAGTNEQGRGERRRAGGGGNWEHGEDQRQDCRCSEGPTFLKRSWAAWRTLSLRPRRSHRALISLKACRSVLS